MVLNRPFKNLPSQNRNKKLNQKSNFDSFEKSSKNNLSFKGTAPQIKSAYIIENTGSDLKLLTSKERNSYVVEFDSQTEMIYGKHAIDYLNSTTHFEFDTQVILPKGAFGVFKKDGKEVELSEDTAIMLNADSKAKISISKGYPLVLISKKDNDWYDRYSKNSPDSNIRNKYLELMYYNSHLYNADVTPTYFLNKDLQDENFLNSIGINKQGSGNFLLYDLERNIDKLPQDKKEQLNFILNFLNKLEEKGIITRQENDNAYISFPHLYNTRYFSELLKKEGFSNNEIELLMPIYKKLRNSHIGAHLIREIKKGDLSDEIVSKLKNSGILHNNRKNTDTLYWKKSYGSETLLRNALKNQNFTIEEQDKIVDFWHKANMSGYDITGLNFIDNDSTIYSFKDKLNNWTLEETNWLTNSTAMMSKNGIAPYTGVSIVQTNSSGAIPMSKLRKGEELHSHPNRKEKRQTEVYLVTTGTAALNVVKDGKTDVQLIKEGELAVISPGVMHCVNSVKGPYEHIVVQVPSVFQYGFSFKQIASKPDDYDANKLEKLAQEKLNQS